MPLRLAHCLTDEAAAAAAAPAAAAAAILIRGGSKAGKYRSKQALPTQD